MRNLFKRESAKTTVSVCNLDKIHSETVVFTLHGKEHAIKPLTQFEFFKWAQAYSDFCKLADRETLTKGELDSGFYKVFSAVCETITEKDTRACSRQQSAVLFGLIVDSITGKSEVDSSADPVKKKLKTSSLH